MRYLHGTWIAALSVLTGMAVADQAPDPLRQSPTQQYPGVWTLAENGDAIHLQSGLTCRIDVGKFHRVGLMVYQISGLDVSCNYKNARGSLITIYLTKRGNDSLNDDFEEAKRELLGLTPSAIQLPQAEATAITGAAREWQRSVYDEKQSTMHSGIWISDLDGWTLEFRATYIPDDESDVMTEISSLTDNAEKSAGPRLNLCGKSGLPDRHANPITDRDQVVNLSVIAGAAGEVKNLKAPNAIANDQDQITWCAESVVSHSSYLLWHAIAADGSDAAMDQLTTTTGGGATLISSVDNDANTILKEENKPADRPIWSVRTLRENEVSVYAFFAGRPDGASLASVMRDIATSGRAPLLKFGGKENTIYIATDPK